MASVSVQQRYGLRRPNYILDPLSDEDADFFAARSGVQVASIIEGLQINLATGLPPKRLFWGPFGGGKTHTLRNTIRQLARMTPVEFVYVECPDMSRKSEFIELYHEGVMRSFGEDFVLKLFEDTRDRVGYARRDELLRRLREALGDEELAKAAAILIDPTEEKRLLLWSWISGVAVPRPELQDLGQTQDLTQAEPARLAMYISILGKLVFDLHKKTLVLVLDEMDRIKNVGPDTIAQFRTAFTRLVDPNQKYVSVLIGCSAPNFIDMPDVFSEGGPIYSRLGREALCEIPALDPPDLDPFMRQIIQYVRDKDANIAALAAAAKTSAKETITETAFPFSEEALEAITAGLGRDMTPREITLSMTHAIGKAHLLNKPAATSDVVV